MSWVQWAARVTLLADQPLPQPSIFFFTKERFEFLNAIYNGCLCVCCVYVYVCVSESEHAVVASGIGDPDRSPTRAGFHHDEVTLVLLVLNSLSNYIQSYAHYSCCGFRTELRLHLCMCVCVYNFFFCPFDLYFTNLLSRRISFILLSYFFSSFFSVLFSLGKDIQRYVCSTKEIAAQSQK